MLTDTRPTTLTTVHNYNLRNQGWPREFSCTDDEAGSGAALRDPVPYTKDRIGVYPSNADVIYYSKTAAAQNAIGIGAYNPWHLKRYSYGNTPAARGHYILNAFDRNREEASGIDSIYDVDRDKEVDRPISVAFYAGRVWYLMPDGRLYFSQILTEIKNAQKCYQEADPTAEDINELVATDGGELNIAEASFARRLVVVGTTLVVLADNGIWSISGDGDGKAFTATGQEIRKITEVGCSGAESVIEAEGAVLYWSSGGIYLLQADQVTADLSANNLTETTIQELYLAIGEAGKKYAKAFYDKQAKKVYWLYNDTAGYDGVTYRYKYNRVLIFDLILQAFYTYTLPLQDDMPWVSGMVEKQAGNITRNVSFVTDSSEVTVTEVDGTPITTETFSVEFTPLKVKFLCFAVQDDDTIKLSFADSVPDDLVDWKSVDSVGVDYTSFAETGEDIVEDLISEKEGNTIYLFFKRTETGYELDGNNMPVFVRPSSCLLQTKWDWSSSVASGRWSSAEQVYRFKRNYIPDETLTFDYGFDVIQTIHQARGKGHSLRLRFESETGKDFHILGWSIPYSLITGA